MHKVILLVEDNASDEKLTLFAFKKCGVANEVVVVRDGRPRRSITCSAPESTPGATPQGSSLGDPARPESCRRSTGSEVLRRIRAGRTDEVPCRWSF